MTSASRYEGRVKWYDRSRGWGFITPDVKGQPGRACANEHSRTCHLRGGEGCAVREEPANQAAFGAVAFRIRTWGFPHFRKRHCALGSRPRGPSYRGCILNAAPNKSAHYSAFGGCTIFGGSMLTVSCTSTRRETSSRVTQFIPLPLSWALTRQWCTEPFGSVRSNSVPTGLNFGDSLIS
jgi:hypothetical protein